MQSPYAVDPLQRGRVSISLTSPETRPATSDLTLSLLLVKALLAISVHSVKTWLLSNAAVSDAEQSTPISVSALNAAFLLLAAVANVLLPPAHPNALAKSKAGAARQAESGLYILLHGLATTVEWWSFWNAIRHLPVFKSVTTSSLPGPS